MDGKWKMEPESLVKCMLSWSICPAVWGLRRSVAKLMYTQATLGVEPERAVFSGTATETAVRAKGRRDASPAQEWKDSRV